MAEEGGKEGGREESVYIHDGNDLSDKGDQAKEGGRVRREGGREGGRVKRVVS